MEQCSNKFGELALDRRDDYSVVRAVHGSLRETVRHETYQEPHRQVENRESVGLQTNDDEGWQEQKAAERNVPGSSRCN